MLKPSIGMMIEWLVDSDINDWLNKADQADYLSMILRNGFSGYDNQSYYELENECRDRDMWDMLVEKANDFNDPVNKQRLVQEVVDCYMDNLSDNPETIREALTRYLSEEDQTHLVLTLSGFKDC